MACFSAVFVAIVPKELWLVWANRPLMAPSWLNPKPFTLTAPGLKFVLVFWYMFRRCGILKGCWLEGPVPLGIRTCKLVPGPGLEVWQVLQVVPFVSKAVFTKML